MTIRKQWTKAEDDTLTQLINGRKLQNQWDRISQELHKMGYNKSPKQAKMRWRNHLSPSLNKSKWNIEDFQGLFNAFVIHGNKWRRIAQMYRGRTENCVKNKFFSCTKKILRQIVKLSDIQLSQCSTKVINQIKPKILGEFMKKDINAGPEENSNQERKIRVIEVFRSFLKNKDCRSLSNESLWGKSVLNECTKLILEMNDDYLANTKRRKIVKNEFQGNYRKTVKNPYEYNIDKALQYPTGISSNNVNGEMSSNPDDTIINNRKPNIEQIRILINEMNSLFNPQKASIPLSNKYILNFKDDLIDKLDSLENLSMKFKHNLSVLDDNQDDVYEIIDILKQEQNDTNSHNYTKHLDIEPCYCIKLGGIKGKEEKNENSFSRNNPNPQNPINEEQLDQNAFRDKFLLSYQQNYHIPKVLKTQGFTRLNPLANQGIDCMHMNRSLSIDKSSLSRGETIKNPLVKECHTNLDGQISLPSGITDYPRKPSIQSRNQKNDSNFSKPTYVKTNMVSDYINANQ